MAARCAWLFGAGRVIVIDHIEYRLDFARTYCPAEVYNFRSLEDPVYFIKKITDSLGADVCIDAVGGDAAGSAMHTLMGTKLKWEAGAATALHWAINSVKKGGTVSIVGVYGPTGCIVPIGNVVNKGITIRANQASVKRLLPRLIEHVEAGRINPKAMITHKIRSELQHNLSDFTSKVVLTSCVLAFPWRRCVLIRIAATGRGSKGIGGRPTATAATICGRSVRRGAQRQP